MSAEDDDQAVLNAQRRFDIEVARLKGEWARYVSMHRGPEQVHAVCRVLEAHGASPTDGFFGVTRALPSDFGRVLISAWITSGWRRHSVEWSWALRVLRKCGVTMTPEYSRWRYDELPDVVQAWRGFRCHASQKEAHARGFSWTLDRDEALEYAGGARADQASHDVPFVASAFIPKSAIHSYLFLDEKIGGREIVIDRPHRIEGIVIEEITTQHADADRVLQ